MLPVVPGVPLTTHLPKLPAPRRVEGVPDRLGRVAGAGDGLGEIGVQARLARDSVPERRVNHIAQPLAAVCVGAALQHDVVRDAVQDARAAGDGGVVAQGVNDLLADRIGIDRIVVPLLDVDLQGGIGRCAIDGCDVGIDSAVVAQVLEKVGKGIFNLSNIVCVLIDALEKTGRPVPTTR